MIFASITLFLLFLFTTTHTEAKQKPPDCETEIHTHYSRFTSRPFATFYYFLLACHRGPRVPRTDGAKVGRGGESHNRFPNISRKNPCFWEKMALFLENQGNMKLLQFQKSEKSCFSPVFSQNEGKIWENEGKSRRKEFVTLLFFCSGPSPLA